MADPLQDEAARRGERARVNRLPRPIICFIVPAVGLAVQAGNRHLNAQAGRG